MSFHKLLDHYEHRGKFHILNVVNFVEEMTLDLSGFKQRTCFWTSFCVNGQRQLVVTLHMFSYPVSRELLLGMCFLMHKRWSKYGMLLKFSLKICFWSYFLTSF